MFLSILFWVFVVSCISSIVFLLSIVLDRIKYGVWYVEEDPIYHEELESQ